MPVATTRHRQALDITTALVEDIRQLTKRLPETEDMVMVPAMREAAMGLQKSLMMLAHGELDDEGFYQYCDEAFGKTARLHIQLQMCLDLGYISADALAAFEQRLDEILDCVSLPKKPRLTVVK